MPRKQFFFSSRRRHTRSYGDWSSDVCSSDLSPRRGAPRRGERLLRLAARRARQARSEERRVGKECRSPSSPHHEKKERGTRRGATTHNVPSRHSPPDHWKKGEESQ